MSRDRSRDDLRSNFWRRKLRPQILERDGWTCHLCNQPIDQKLKSPHPMSASVDHIRGAKSGFDPRFLRAAHRICNVRQGDPTRAVRGSSDPTPAGGTRW